MPRSTPLLLNEFLKEHKKVEKQQATIAHLKSNAAKQEATIAELKEGMRVLTAQLKEQETQIQKVSAQIEMTKTSFATGCEQAVKPSVNRD